MFQDIQTISNPMVINQHESTVKSVLRMRKHGKSKKKGKASYKIAKSQSYHILLFLSTTLSRN